MALSAFLSRALIAFLLHSSYFPDKTSAKTQPPHPSLRQAYTALQAWKQAIYSDPTNLTSNWAGPSVCNYNGVYCTSSLDDPALQVVAGIDLNHADIAGSLPDELGLLTDLALLHVNSNRFCGLVPLTISNLSLLFELDLSNNRFAGPFPRIVLSLPSLRFLDIRFNEFEGPLPPALFDKPLDAIFLNNNRLTSAIPLNLGGSSASVIVFANNDLGGCLPPSIARLANSLQELVLMNTNISGCLPDEIGSLYKLRVLDVSGNMIVGPIPDGVAGLGRLEQLNVARNMMSGTVRAGVCGLGNLVNFTYSDNFFCEEEEGCGNGTAFDDRRNCVAGRAEQKSREVCEAAYEHPVECLKQRCDVGGGGVSAMPVGAPMYLP